MTIALVIIIVLTSWYTFRNPVQYDKYLFRVDDILVHREFYRLVSSGFAHLNWFHLGFNAVSLYLFGEMVEKEFSILQYLFLYLGSLVGGSLLALFIHRNHGDYAAAGASGAISGIMFAYTLLYPDSGVGFIMVPFHINAVVFSLLFVVVSVYGIKSQKGRVAHDAHLGGAVTGLILAGMLRPDVFLEHRGTFLLLFLPVLFFLVVIWWKPEIMLIEGYARYIGQQTREQRRQKKRRKEDPEAEINRILDKINRSGVESLTRRERERLKKEE